MGNPSRSYEASRAVPATRHKWTRPAITPTKQAGTRFTYPGRIEGWVDLGNLIPARPGIEPTTAWSRLLSVGIMSQYAKNTGSWWQWGQSQRWCSDGRRTVEPSWVVLSGTELSAGTHGPVNGSVTTGEVSHCRTVVVTVCCHRVASVLTRSVRTLSSTSHPAHHVA